MKNWRQFVKLFQYDLFVRHATSTQLGLYLLPLSIPRRPWDEGRSGIYITKMADEESEGLPIQDTIYKDRQG